jgi:hypothetical protein
MYARTVEGPWVLYDLKRDPYEQKDLSRDPAHAEVREQLEAKLTAWMERTGDSWDFNSMAPVEDQGRLYRFETFSTIQEYLDWAARHPELAPRE